MLETPQGLLGLNVCCGLSEGLPELQLYGEFLEKDARSDRWQGSVESVTALMGD